MTLYFSPFPLVPSPTLLNEKSLTPVRPKKDGSFEVMKTFVVKLLDWHDVIRAHAKAQRVLIEEMRQRQEATVDCLRDIVDIPDRLADGLREAGYVEEAESVEKVVDEWIVAKLARDAGTVE